MSENPPSYPEYPNAHGHQSIEPYRTGSHPRDHLQRRGPQTFDYQGSQQMPPRVHDLQYHEAFIPPHQRAPYPTAYQHPYAAVGFPFPAPPKKGLSVASMIIGIVSIFDIFFWAFPVLGFVMSIAPLVGLILGICGATKEKQARGFSITGIILNSLMLLGGLIAGLIVILVMGALLAV